MLRAAIARVSAKLITRGSITEFENIHPVPISGELIQKSFNAKPVYDCKLKFEVRINSPLLPLQGVTDEF
jgi:hypothetical protein